MKKFVALLLALLLSFAIAVPSFATESGSVTVTNFPAYFTGAYDNSISAELIAINNLLDTYLADIWINTDQLYNYAIDIYNHMLEFDALAAQQFIVQGEFFLHVKEHLENMYLYDQLSYNFLVSTFRPQMTEGFEDVVSAVNGTTGAVNSFNGTFQDFWEVDWSYQMKQSDIPDTIAYRLRMLQEVLADEKDLEMKKAAESSTDGVFQNFVKGSGSVNGSDIGSVLTLSNWFQGFFGGDAGTDAGSYINTSVNNLSRTLSDTSDSSPFAWFTQANANAMDSVSSAYSRNIDPAINPVIVTHYYQDKISDMESVKEMFGFGESG